MVLYVDPDELRQAASRIGEQPMTGSVAMDPRGSVAHDLWTGGFAIAGTATAEALSAAKDAAQEAVDVVRARMGAWEASLAACAESYQVTEELAARRLDALGDFNGSSGYRS